MHAAWPMAGAPLFSCAHAWAAWQLRAAQLAPPATTPLVAWRGSYHAHCLSLGLERRTNLL